MIHRLEFHAMGCRMEALIDNDSRPDILNEVPAWFEEWEQVLSRFRIDSELSRLNLSAGHAVPVSQVLWDVFEVSREAEKLTNGLVNPLILDALIHAGYDQSFEHSSFDTQRFLPNLEADVPSLRDVIADDDARSIFLPKGMQLDFGGVAKGWTAHQAVERLRMVGPSLVNAGGDIAISGPQLNGDAWPIGVENPYQRDAEIEVLYLERGGIATSGKDYHHWMRNGIAQHHIIDPRTGLPAETDILTATIMGPTAMEAEAMAKVVMILGSTSGLAQLDQNIELAGLLVLENGKRLYSRNIDRFL
jgi:thiamine biosynthesis lipoprotein